MDTPTTLFIRRYDFTDDNNFDPVWHNMIIRHEEQYVVLVYMRFGNWVISLLVVVFNIYLIFYFTKMFKFLLEILSRNKPINTCLPYTLYFLFVFFMVLYLIDQYLYQNTQYAIAGIIFLIKGVES